MRTLVFFVLLLPLLLQGNDSISLFNSSPSDHFQFGILWDSIKPWQEKKLLYDLIEKRSLEIKKLKETWRPFVETSYQENKEFFSDFWNTLQEGDLVLTNKGAGSAYFLYDSYNHPQFVIKPTDEDIFCLHNPKHFASPFFEQKDRARTHIPLYRSALTEALCYELAKLCHLTHITPQTVLSLVSHPQFFDISQHITSQEELEKYLHHERFIDKEKLCSVQHYLPKSICLRELLMDLFSGQITDAEIQERFDQEDFEDINLLIWITYDNDAHLANFRAYPKKINDNGAQVYGLQKIDNGLSFPESHSEFSNALMYFPNALKPLSSRICNQIENLSIQEMKKIIEKFGLNSCLSAFEERMSLLKELIWKENITYYECNLRLALLEKEEGISIARREASLKELEDLAMDLPKKKISHLKSFEIGSFLRNEFPKDAA